MMEPLIAPDRTAALWAMITVGTAAAIWLEQSYRWASRLSGPVLALLIAMALSNARVAPSAAPAYDFVGDWLVPLAIPLLLFRANLGEIVRSCGRILLIFHLSSLGTIIGVALAVWLVGGRLGASDAGFAAGLMAASYTGGGVNFMAIKTSYQVDESLAGPLIVADNFVMAGMFVVMLAMASSRWFRARFPHPHSLAAGGEEASNLAAAHWRRKDIGLLDIARSLAFAFVVLALAEGLRRAIEAAFEGVSASGVAWQTARALCVNPFVLITGVSVALATAFGRSLKQINGPEELGAYLLMVFLFTLGLPADLVSVLREAPVLFVFCGIIAAANLAFTLAAGRLLRLNLEELLLAVNANLGGAPSAAAVAVSAGWPRLVLPGLLVGIWGYVVGTPIGVTTVEWLR